MRLLHLAFVATAVSSASLPQARELTESTYLSVFYPSSLICTGPIAYQVTEADADACHNVDLNAGGSVSIKKWSKELNELWLYPEENCKGLPVTNLDHSGSRSGRTRECYQHTVAAKSWSVKEFPWWEDEKQGRR